MDAENILNHLMTSFEFVIKDWGLKLTEKSIRQYGPVIVFSSKHISIEIFFDMRENDLRIKKYIFGDDNEINKIYFLSDLISEKGVEYFTKINAPSTFAELQTAVIEWVKIFRAYEKRIVSNENL